jgi:AraC-like DNA-binding protein
MRSAVSWGLIAGFSADRPIPGLPELAAVGDQWAPVHRLMGWHSHLEWEIYLQIAGNTQRGSESACYPMRPGDVFLAPPHARHRVFNRGSGKEHNGFIRCRLDPVFRRQPGLAPLWRFTECKHLPAAGAVMALFQQLMREVTLDQQFRARGAQCALDAVVIEVSRLIGSWPARILAPLPASLVRARELIERDCARPWPLVDLARAVQVSPSHLLALFRQHLGTAPHRYQLEQRIARAQHLLAHGDESISGIAHELGFSSSQHFARTFRALSGATASAYRQGARGGQSGPASPDLVPPSDLKRPPARTRSPRQQRSLSPRT